MDGGKKTITCDELLHQLIDELLSYKIDLENFILVGFYNFWDFKEFDFWSKFKLFKIKVSLKSKNIFKLRSIKKPFDNFDQEFSGSIRKKF